MEEEANSAGKMLERIEKYGRSGIDLLKLKAHDKSSDVITSVIPHPLVLFLISTFLIFLNPGVTPGLGEIPGKQFYGFYIAAAFYVSFAFLLHFSCNSRSKAYSDIIIKIILKKH